jgi:hypothetical protein
MSEIALILGPIVFKDFEIPARIAIGGKQRLAVHQLVGGGRVVDALGRDDAEISFEGVFAGSDATLRARMLDELRAAGQPLSLTWDVFYYTVVVSRFAADYRSSWWIPFCVTCTVLRDEAAAFSEAVVTVAQSALADIAVAAGFQDQAGIDLGAAQLALAAPAAGTLGTVASAQAQASLGMALSSLAASRAVAETQLAAQAAPSGPEVGSMIATVGQATTSAGQLAALTAANAFVGRAAIQIANAST